MYFLKNKKFKLKNDVEKILTVCSLFHDFGKYSKDFQNKLKNNNSNYKVEHSLISAIFTYYIAKEGFNLSEEDSYICFLVVKNHHSSKIKKGEFLDISKNIEKKKYNLNIIIKEYTDLLNELGIKIKNLDQNIKNFFEEYEEVINDLEAIMIKGLDYYFKLIISYSILCDSDKLLASLDGNYELIIKIIEDINPDFEKDIVKEYVDNLGKTKDQINELRRKAFYEADENLDPSKKIFFLDLPTGFGKTTISLHIANKLVKKHSKIIYCLPYTTIIDQNYEVTKKIFGNSFVNRDHYLSVKEKDQKINKILKNIEDLENNSFEYLLNKNWHYKITVTTFVQLFESLILGKSSYLLKLHNLINSVIILDEIQLIDTKSWNICFFGLYFLVEYFNCKIIISSATLPKNYFLNFYFNIVKNDLYERLKKIEKEVRDKFCNYSQNLINNDYYIFNRYKIENIGSINSFEVLENIIKDKKGTVLIVFNIIRHTQLFYEYLKNKGYKNIICLNTKIVPKHRLERLKNYEQKIIISTQLIEAGVDIDVDYIIRDFCNLDSLIQTAGRCNRHNRKKQGNVFLMSFKLEEDKFLASKKIYDSISLEITEKYLKNVKDEKTIYSIIQQYYRDLNNKGIFKEKDTYIKDILMINFSKQFCLIEDDNIPVIINIDKECDEIIKKIKELKQKIKNIKEYTEKFNILAKIKDLKKLLWNYSIHLKKYEIKNNLDLFDEYMKMFILNDPEHDERYNFEIGFKITKNDDFSCI